MCHLPCAGEPPCPVPRTLEVTGLPTQRRHEPHLPAPATEKSAARNSPGGCLKSPSQFLCISNLPSPKLWGGRMEGGRSPSSLHKGHPRGQAQSNHQPTGSEGRSWQGSDSPRSSAGTATHLPASLGAQKLWPGKSTPRVPVVNWA